LVSSLVKRTGIEEPYAGILHVRVCGGGVGQPMPLPGSKFILDRVEHLGFEVAERTVSNLMPRHAPNSKPSQTWRTFLKNHGNKCSIDFFTVPTVTFNVLFVLVILSHSRRKVVHFNITSNPRAEWTTQQIVEAFPRNRVKNMGIKEVVSAPQSPWQNPFVDRLD